MTVQSLNRLELERFVPKYVRLRQQLMNRIRQLQPGESLPPIADIRKTYKVSQPTVDRAIQELRSEGLLQSRRGSGVYVTDLAKVLKVGIFFGHNVFEARFPAFEQGLIRSLLKQSRVKKVLLRSYLDEMEEELPPTPTQFHMDVAAGRLDGLLTTMGPHLQPLYSLGLPVIPLCYNSTNNDRPRVQLNYEAIVKLGVKTLAERGCKRVGQFGHPQTINGPFSEVEAFNKTLTECGLQTHENWCCYWREFASLELVGYREFLRFWRKPGPKPDGLICTDDNVTSGMIFAAKELGIKIGTDLLIASHANRGLSTFGDAPVIRIEFDLERVADAMLDCLIDAINAKQDTPNFRVIDPELCH